MYHVSFYLSNSRIHKSQWLINSNEAKNFFTSLGGKYRTMCHKNMTFSLISLSQTRVFIITLHPWFANGEIIEFP